MTPEQLDEIEKLARDPKSAAFHDLMARQTIPLVKALREARAVIDHYERKDGPTFQAHLGEVRAEWSLAEAKAEVARLQEQVEWLLEGRRQEEQRLALEIDEGNEP